MNRKLELVMPSTEQLSAAVARAKESGFSSSDIKNRDAGAQSVRRFLGPDYHDLPIEEVRRLVQNLSRAGKEPGTQKRTAASKFESIRERMVKLYPRAESHSREYAEIHASDEYKEIVRALKIQTNYTCQGCGGVFVGSMLEGHIIDYSRWRDRGMILVACHDCHPVLDVLVRRGKTLDSLSDAGVFS